jgi:prostamide/prostaglandin F2alpha synthase
MVDGIGNRSVAVAAAGAAVAVVGLAFLLTFFTIARDTGVSSSASSTEMGTEKGSRIVTAAIKDIQVEKIHGPGDAASVNISSFWEHQPVVIHVLRRFGCQLCRGNAVVMSRMLPQLEANNIRLVGIGIEKLGLEEFEEGGYWKGELYIDHGKKIHKALELKSVSIVSALMMIFANKAVKDAAQKTKDTPGNFKGDGRQLGATFVVGKGGEMLLDFRQRDFADQPSTVSILDALGLDSSDVKEERAAPAVCTD